jgi:hypothetical protein
MQTRRNEENTTSLTNGPCWSRRTKKQGVLQTGPVGAGEPKNKESCKQALLEQENQKTRSLVNRPCWSRRTKKQGVLQTVQTGKKE